MSLKFNSNDFRVNRKMVNEVINDSEIESFDMVEVVDLNAQQSLVVLSKDDDEILFKFYYFLSKKFGDLKEWFSVGKEALGVVSDFFGKSAWDKGSNTHIKVFKEYENIEIRFM